MVQDGARWCKIVQYHAIPCNTMQYHAKPCNTMQNHAIPCNTMQYHALPCNTMQYNAIPCNTLQYHAIPCHTMHHWWHWWHLHKRIKMISDDARQDIMLCEARRWNILLSSLLHINILSLYFGSSIMWCCVRREGEISGGVPSSSKKGDNGHTVQQPSRERFKYNLLIKYIDHFKQER